MEWQTIESAPKDGTKVLLWTDSHLDDWYACMVADEGGEGGMEHFACAQIGYWEGAADAPLRSEPAQWHKELVGEPTHWMPLPDPPKEEPQ